MVKRPEDKYGQVVVAQVSVGPEAIERLAGVADLNQLRTMRKILLVRFEQDMTRLRDMRKTIGNCETATASEFEAGRDLDLLIEKLAAFADFIKNI